MSYNTESGMPSHYIDIDKLMEIAEEDDNLGICKACGEVNSGVEPDAEYYTCFNCGKNEVFGTEILLMEV